jgi:hypothetical protein
MPKCFGSHKSWFAWPAAVSLALLVGVLMTIGCGKKPAAEAVPPTAPVAAIAGQPGPEAELKQLTLALRKYSFEHRHVPASFSELIAAGNLAAVPAAPAGKKFAIEPKAVQVILVNR